MPGMEIKKYHRLNGVLHL